MSNVKATWSISLDCTCPSCEHDFDILSGFCMPDGMNLYAGEHGTERTENMKISCPACGHEFLVDCYF